MNKFKVIIFLGFFFVSSMIFGQTNAPTIDDVTNYDGIGTAIPMVNLSITSPQDGQGVAFSVQLLIILALLSLSPSIILLMTGFLRIFLVLDFVRRALSLQQSPPTQVLAGISIFLTIFMMWPTFSQMYQESFIPMSNNEISLEEAGQKFMEPMRLFMYKQLNGNYEQIQTFMDLAGLEPPETLADVPTYVLIPAFVINELKIAFIIGVIISLPFIVVDMIVSSVLMSMGMIMLPPIMISLPFKIILFVLVDGWGLIVDQLIMGFLN